MHGFGHAERLGARQRHVMSSFQLPESRPGQVDLFLTEAALLEGRIGTGRTAGKQGVPKLRQTMRHLPYHLQHMVWRTPGADAGVAQRWLAVIAQPILYTSIQHFRDDRSMARCRRTVAGKRLSRPDTQKRRADHGITFGNAGGKPITVPRDDRLAIPVRADCIRIAQG